MRLSDRLSRFVLVFVTTVGATFTILLAGGSGSLESLPIRAIYLGMAALGLIPWLVGAIFRPSWRPSSRLMPAIVVILVSFAISTATSRNPRLSIEMLGYAVLLLLVYLLLVTLMRRPEIRSHFERLALLLALLVSGLYVLQVALLWVEWWGLIGRLAIPPLRPAYAGLTLGSPNPVATLVLLLGAFAIGANELRGRARRFILPVLITLVGLATFVSGSRGAWLGAAIALTVAVLVTAAMRPDLRKRGLRIARSRLGSVAIAAALLTFFLALSFAAVTGRLTFDDGGYRAGFARASLEMFGSSPLTGVGPGLWPVLRAQNTLATDADIYIPHAHNVYLQTLAEFGALGVVAAVVLMVVLAALIRRALTSGDRSRQSVSMAALFSMALFAAQQLGDVLVNVPALLLALALPIAWLDAVGQPMERVGESREVQAHVKARLPLLGTAIMVVLVLVGLARMEVIANTADQAVAAADLGNWSEARSLFAQAAAADPDLDAYRFQLGVSAANVGDLRLAEEALKASASADDYTYAWLDLAAVRWQLSDVAGARYALGRAERLGLRRVSVALGAGWLRQQLGDHDLAVNNYAAALELHPMLATDPFWSSTGGPPGGLDQVLAATELRASIATTVHLYLIVERFDQAFDIAASIAASDPDLYPNVVRAWRGDPAAQAALQAVASSRPLDPVPITWLRHIAEHQEDGAAVGRYNAWLATLRSTESELPGAVGIEFGSPQSLPRRFLDRYGSVYRRDILGAQVVGVLPQLVVWENP